MKRKFNLYCVLLLTVVIISLVSAVLEFSRGYNQGWDAAEASYHRNSGKQKYELAELELDADDPSRCELALLNTATGRMDSLRVRQVAVWVAVDENELDSTAMKVLGVAVALAVLVCFVAFFVIFIKLIIAVNRGENFSLNATVRLRRMGVLMIGLFLCRVVIMLIYAPPAVSYRGYTVSSVMQIDYMPLIIGLGLLVGAHLFGIGQQLREENDLTI